MHFILLKIGDTCGKNWLECLVCGFSENLMANMEQDRETCGYKLSRNLVRIKKRKSKDGFFN